MNKYTLIANKPKSSYSGSWGFFEEYESDLKIYVNKDLDDIVKEFTEINLLNADLNPHEDKYRITILFNDHIFYTNERADSDSCIKEFAGRVADMADLSHAEYVQYLLFFGVIDKISRIDIPEKIEKKKQEKKEEEEKIKLEKEKVREAREREEFERLKKKFGEN